MSKLAKCPTCQERISKQATSCPKCGQPLAENWGKEADAGATVESVIKFIVYAGIVLGFYAYFFGDSDPTERSGVNRPAGILGEHVVTANSLNIRKSPSVKSEILGTANRCTLVKVVGFAKGWAKIELETDAWVSREYIRPEGQGSQCDKVQPLSVLPPMSNSTDTTIVGVEKLKCNKFDLQAELNGDQLKVSLDSDCPEFASIFVSVRRSFFEKGNTGYSHDYFSEKSTVGKWREATLVSVAHTGWLELLKQEQAKFSRLGMGYDIARIEDKLTARAVLHVNQPDKRFGKQNENLIGEAMSTEGMRVAESEVRISFPVPAGPEVFEHFPSLDPQALELKQSYLLSKQTPLMRVPHTDGYSFEEIMNELKEMKYIPAGYVIEIFSRTDVGSTPRYEVVVWDTDRNRRGSGWVNSDALISQKLEAVRR